MKEYRMSQPKLFEKLIQVFGSISAISGKKILVIRDLEVALMLSVRNAVVYITDDEECSEAFRKNTEAGMGNDDKVFFINNYKTELKELLNDMHFDVAIQNPPYDRNLHLKILAEVLKHADKVINISPVRWLQDPFAAYSNKSDYKKFEESVSKKIETLDIIPAKEASELFNASFTMNLGIYTCGQGGWNYRYDDPLVNKIVTKTMENSWAKYAYSKRYMQALLPYQMNVSGIHSATAVNPLMCNTYTAQLQTKVPNMKSHNACNSCIFDFATEDERKNFYDCYNTAFIAWLCSLWRVDIHINSVKVPYFGDYTAPWTNEKFKAYFELTDDEWARIEREMAKMNQ